MVSASSTAQVSFGVRWPWLSPSRLLSTGAALVAVVVALGLGAVGAQTIRHRGDLAAALSGAPRAVDRRLYWQGVVGGATMIVLGVGLAIGGRKE